VMRIWRKVSSSLPGPVTPSARAVVEGSRFDLIDGERLLQLLRRYLGNNLAAYLEYSDDTGDDLH
jgi:hypothetical protein